MGLTLPTPPSPNLYYGAYVSPGRGEDAYAAPTILPNLTLGWRQQRVTATLDGQLYRSRNADGFTFGGLLFRQQLRPAPGPELPPGPPPRRGRGD